MIGTAVAPESLPNAGILRALIQQHRVSHCEVLACRFALFYQESLVELHTHIFEKTNVVRACMETLLSASACMLEFQTVVSDPDRATFLGNLSAYGFVQALTQIVEAMAGLEKPLHLDFKNIFGHKNGNKEREYWRFRIRHSHVVGTREKVRSTGDPEGSDDHVFRLGRTSAGHIQYMTLAEHGFMTRTISTDQIAWESQTDLGSFSDAALTAIRTRPER